MHLSFNEQCYSLNLYTKCRRLILRDATCTFMKCLFSSISSILMISASDGVSSPSGRRMRSSIPLLPVNPRVTDEAHSCGELSVSWVMSFFNVSFFVIFISLTFAYGLVWKKLSRLSDCIFYVEVEFYFADALRFIFAYYSWIKLTYVLVVWRNNETICAYTAVICTVLVNWFSGWFSF